MDKRKIIRYGILLLGFLLAYFLYHSEYYIRPNEEDVQQAISKFIERDIVIEGMEKIDNRLAVYYHFGSNDYIGFTALHRGINGLYHIRGVSYGTRNQVIKFTPFVSRKKSYLALMGTNYDGKIASIEFNTYSQESFFVNIEDQPKEILVIVETDYQTFLEKMTLYDIHGTDITEEMKDYLTTTESSSTSRAKMEHFMLYVFCVGIIGVALLIFWNCRHPKKPQLET
ncbi:MAG: hypothetical protein JJT76_09135 [Clostridiaceae bacterium]|nr:hypothetical protein [Clostridiaceae bacterium]